MIGAVRSNQDSVTFGVILNMNSTVTLMIGREPLGESVCGEPTKPDVTMQDPVISMRKLTHLIYSVTNFGKPFDLDKRGLDLISKTLSMHRC